MHSFQYGLVYRPAGLGAIPNIPHQVLPSLSDEDGARLTRHGILVTERHLTDKEIVAYELALIANGEQKEELAILVALSMGDYAAEYVAEATEHPADFQIAVIQSLRRVRPYQIHVGPWPHFAEMVKRRLEARIGMPETTVHQGACA